MKPAQNMKDAKAIKAYCEHHERLSLAFERLWQEDGREILWCEILLSNGRSVFPKIPAGYLIRAVSDSLCDIYKLLEDQGIDPTLDAEDERTSIGTGA